MPEKCDGRYILQNEGNTMSTNARGTLSLEGYLIIVTLITTVYATYKWIGTFNEINFLLNVLIMLAAVIVGIVIPKLVWRGLIMRDCPHPGFVFVALCFAVTTFAGKTYVESNLGVPPLQKLSTLACVLFLGIVVPSLLWRYCVHVYLCQEKSLEKEENAFVQPISLAQKPQVSDAISDENIGTAQVDNVIEK